MMPRWPNSAGGRFVDLFRSYEIVDELEALYGTRVEIDLDKRGNFDYHAADRWCHQNIGGPSHEIKLSMQDGQTGWLVLPKEGNGWCTHQNNYFFARSSDALIFKLSL